MKHLMRYGLFCISLILLVSCAILSVDLDRVDDLPHHRVIEEDILGTDGEADTGYEQRTTEGGKTYLYKKEVSLETGDSFMVRFTLNNKSEQACTIIVDLRANGYDRKYNEFTATAQPGENLISGEIPFYREEHPPKSKLRVFTANY